MSQLSKEQRPMRQRCRDFVDALVIPFIRKNWQREWLMTPEDRPRSLNDGQTVEYEIESNRGKESAVNLKIKMTVLLTQPAELAASACRACGACCSFSPEWPCTAGPGSWHPPCARV